MMRSTPGNPQDPQVHHGVFEKGNVEGRGPLFAGKVEEQHHPQGYDKLPRQLAPGGKPRGVVAGYLEVVVDKADKAKGGKGPQGKPDLFITKIHPQEHGYEQ
jgi:hypothetical protein